MRIEQTIKITTSNGDKVALKRVNQILRNLADAFPDTVLCSNITGECIDTKEIARVLGILGFFEASESVGIVPPKEDNNFQKKGLTNSIPCGIINV